MQVHQYKSGDLNIVLDGPSGSVHVVDDLSNDAVANLAAGRTEAETADLIAKERGEAVSREEIGEVLAEIRELKENGLLFTPEPYAPAITEFAERPTVVKALCLHIAHDCNLACRYCFAEEGEYHGRRALMDLETGKKALRFLVTHSGARRNLEVDFFGGEPLMNWEVVKELVAYGRELEKEYPKNFRFTLTTNGVLLNDEVMDFCNREMDNVVMSLDGRQAVHDHMRPFRNGKGSYELVVPKFQKFAAQRKALGKQYYIRGTYTHYNLDFARDVIHFADLGFDQLSMEPVVAPADADYAIRPEDILIKETAFFFMLHYKTQSWQEDFPHIPHFFQIHNQHTRIKAGIKISPAILKEV